MRLSELIRGDGLTAPPDVLAAGPDPEVAGLAADSRLVRPGYLFAALPGSRADGRSFVGDAVARGAVAVLAPPGLPIEELPQPVPVISDPNPRRRLARLAARFFGGQPHTIAAVTGTSGKTSVVDFTRQIWRGAGFRAASLGTLGVVTDGEAAKGGSLTTPDPVELHRLLAELHASGVDHLAMEASSHGLDQCRLDGVRVSAAAFTNLSHDHLDYHAGMAEYLAAKARLFDRVMAPGGTAVLNLDAPEYPRLAAVCGIRSHHIVTYGTSPGADFRLTSRLATGDGQMLGLIVHGRARETVLPLVGEFQALNALCAVAVVAACGLGWERALEAISALKGVPGRLERAARLANGALVYVDYAHKPAALEHVLLTLRPHCKGRLAVVFGCGGDRDRAKRPAMGEIAARLADWTIITDDNPRSEDPATIRAAILAGCPGAADIADRREAIRAGVAALRSEDVLVVAGKGHERGQTIGEETRPFDDVAEVRAAVADLEGRS